MPNPWLIGGGILGLIALLGDGMNEEEKKKKIKGDVDLYKKNYKQCKKNTETFTTFFVEWKLDINPELIDIETLELLVSRKKEFDKKIKNYEKKVENFDSIYSSENLNEKEALYLSKIRDIVDEELKIKTKKWDEMIVEQVKLLKNMKENFNELEKELNKRKREIYAREQFCLSMDVDLGKIDNEMKAISNERIDFVNKWTLNKSQITLDGFSAIRKDKDIFFEDITAAKVNINGLLGKTADLLNLVREEDHFIQEKYLAIIEKQQTNLICCLEQNKIDENKLENRFKIYDVLIQKNNELKEIRDSSRLIISNLQIKFDNCRNKVENSFWHRIEDSMMDALREVNDEKKSLLKNIAEIEPITIDDANCFSDDIKNMNDNLILALKSEIETKCEVLENEMRAFWNQYMVSAENIPVQETNSNREQVYIKYNCETCRTLLQINGENVSNDSSWIMLQQKKIQDWFDKDHNWKGFVKELVNEINDDFDILFNGSIEEFDILRNAFDVAVLNDYHYSIRLEVNEG